MSDTIPQPTAKPIQPPVARPAPVAKTDEPEMPVSTSVGGKEQAPMPVAAPADREGSDQPTVEDGEDVVVQQAAPAGEVAVSPELKELGVEAKADTEKPKISEEVQAAGVAPAKAATPVVPTEPAEQPKYPMSYEEALLIKKKNRFKIKDSITWFATQMTYLWKKAAAEQSEKEKETIQ